MKAIEMRLVHGLGSQELPNYRWKTVVKKKSTDTAWRNSRALHPS